MVKNNKRGRPIGSTNKPKSNKVEIKQKGDSRIITINLDKQIQGTPICKNTNRGWISWGTKNNYPDILSELYYNTVVHKACIDFMSGAIIGEGVDYAKMNLVETEVMPNYTETWDSFLKKLSLDYTLYGSYAFQIIKNKDNQTYSYYHEPMSNVRQTPKDENGQVSSYYICSDWTTTAVNPPILIDRFGFTEDEEIKQGKPYLFVYENYCPNMNYGWVPSYIGGMKAIQTEVELIRYDLKSVVNNFSASGLLTLNRTEDEAESQALIDGIQAMFTGSDNANTLIINFKNSDEETPATFTKIDKDSTQVDLFDQSNDRNTNRILASHRISTKSLIGLPSDSSGFSSDSQLMEAAFNLLNKTVVKNYRQDIVGTINKMFALNGIDTMLVLKPYSFNLIDVVNEVEVVDYENGLVEDAEANYNNNNVEEKVNTNG